MNRRSGQGLLLVLILLWPVSGALAQSKIESLVADLSTHRVELEYSFTGSTLLIFGAVDHQGRNAEARKFDVVVRLVGPPEAVTVRKKERVAGLWVNKSEARLDEVPGYVAIRTSRPPGEFAAPAELVAAGLDLSALAVRPEVDADFSEGFVRNRILHNLYSATPGGVSILSNTLFRAELPLPSNTPVGTYTAEIYVFEDGRAVTASNLELIVEKAGFSLMVASFAQEHSLAYGLLAVMLALSAGWLAGFVGKD